MTRTLDIHPAWGFEWKERWQVAVDQRDKTNPTSKDYHNWGLQRMSANNLSKVAAYIPILNVIIGIARAVLMSKVQTNNPIKKAILRRHIYRGVAEICLGPLLIIPDVIQTIRDAQVVKNYTFDGAKPEFTQILV